jgi:hypothetical protein
MLPFLLLSSLSNFEHPLASGITTSNWLLSVSSQRNWLTLGLLSLIPLQRVDHFPCAMQATYGVVFNALTPTQMEDVGECCVVPTVSMSWALHLWSRVQGFVRIVICGIFLKYQSSLESFWKDAYECGIVFPASPLAANYMRNDEKRAYGSLLAGGEASEAKVCNIVLYAQLSTCDANWINHNLNTCITFCTFHELE